MIFSEPKAVRALPSRNGCHGLAQTLKQVAVIEGIEAQEHDFFTPQPIKR
jgi:hypothetical protein